MIGRAISYQTYVQFAKKYKIPIKTKTGKLRTMSSLSKSIYQYEKTHNVQLPGLYKGI